MMTDREMLLIAYGALLVASTSSTHSKELKDVVVLVEEHLYPAKEDVRPADTLEHL